MRTFVNANTTTDTQTLRDVRFAGFFIHNDAFLTVANRWTEYLTFIIAFLRLTMIFF